MKTIQLGDFVMARAIGFFFLWMFLISSSAWSQNLVTNGDFELGYANGWNHLAGNGGSAVYSEETISHYEGSKALKVNVAALGVNSWDVQSLGPTVALTVGEDYNLTYWAKTASAGTSVRMVIQSAVYLADTKSLSTTWTQYTWTFTAQEASPSIRIQYPGTGTIWLDDIQLVTVTPPPPGPIQVTLSPQTQHQTMVGFGGALSWYSAWMYYGTKADEINQLMFDDLGLDILRLKNWYYPTNYPTQTAMQPEASFDAAKNFYDAAKATNPDIQVFLSSWSPPANLKSNGERANGGTLTKDGNGNYHYAEFAQYWVDCLDNLGWTPDYLSFQNEPGWVASWDSCIFEPTETATYAGYAEAADTIWNAIKDRPNAPRLIGSEAENMPAFFNLNTPILSKPYFDVHAYHTYDIQNSSAIDSSTTINRLRKIRDDFGDRPNWMTEYSNDGLDWIQTARVVHNTVAEANASAYVYWKLAWVDTSPGYMIGLTNSNFSSYTVGPHFYAIKHYAKHIDRGYKRIEIDGSNANVKVSGYLSGNRSSITLVAINQNTATEQIELGHSLSISGIQGYQSVAGNYYQTMTGLNVANPIDLPAASLTTIVLTLSSPYNAPPVANDSNGTTDFNTALPIALTATDADGDDLTYSVVSGPGNGTLSGTPPNVIYTPGVDFSGPDSFTFKANDTLIDSNIATVSITVNPANIPPIADDLSETVFLNTAESFTLSGSDPDSGPQALTYTVISDPANGSLSGTPPNMTYTPNTNFSGADSFTFKTNDGQNDSNVATVSLTILSTPNTPPTVNAGPDQTVTFTGLQAGQPVPGADIFLDAGQDPDNGTDSTWQDTLSVWNLTLDTLPAVTYLSNAGSALSGVTAAYEFPGGNNGDGGAAGTSFNNLGGWDLVPVTIEIWFKPNSVADDGQLNGQVLFETGGGNGLGIFYNDGTVEVGLNTTEVISGVDVSALANEYIQVVMTYDLLGTGDVNLYVNGEPAATGNQADTDWSGSDGAGLGGRGASNVGGRGNGDANTESFEGKIAVFRAYQNQILTAGEVLTNYESIAGSVATTTLDGTVSDANGHSLTTVWSVISGPGTVTFGDSSSVNTTATFSQPGTYVLRLTANDGYDQAYDECIINVVTGGGPISDVNLPAGISLYGYTGENTINAQAAFQTLIDNSQLSIVRWVNPADGQIKELYYTTFPSAAWVNEIGDLTLGSGYVVKTTAICTLSVTGNKSTASLSHNLPAGYSIVGFNQETPLDTRVAFQPLIDAGKLDLVRWVDPSNGQIKELYYTTFPSAGWVNEIGNLTEGQGYIIKLNAPHTGFSLP